MPFDDWSEFLKKRARRKFYTRIPDDNVLDKDYQPSAIMPQEDYFEIRVAEMFLRYKSEYGRSFIPLSVVASEFSYDGKRRTFPFLVGNELLQDIETYVQGEDVNFHNTRVVGPVPYRGDDVGLFVGLFRVQVDDFAKKLLDVLGQVVGVFDISKLSNYIDVAGVLTDGLYSLLHFKQIEYRTGDRDVFQDHGTPVFSEGYYAYVNCEENALEPGQLWVENGSLYTGPSEKQRDPLREHDYSLVRIRRLEQRNDYSTLDFDRTWRQVHDHISRGDHGIGHSLFLECCRQISSSPELTPRHAQTLIEVFMARYAKVVERYDKLNKLNPQRTATVYRGPGDEILSPQLSIQKAAKLAFNAGIDEEVLQGLMEISTKLNKIPHLETVDTDLSDDALNDQLMAVQEIKSDAEPNPKALAEALAIASVTAR